MPNETSIFFYRLAFAFTGTGARTREFIARSACVRRVYYSLLLAGVVRPDFEVSTTADSRRREKVLPLLRSEHAQVFFLLLLLRMVCSCESEVQHRVSFTSYEQKKNAQRRKKKKISGIPNVMKFGGFALFSGSAGNSPQLVRAKPLKEEQRETSRIL